MNPLYGAYTERAINWGRRTCRSPSYWRNHESETFGERQDRTQDSGEPAGGEGSDVVAASESECLK